jgi:hypothetical protein
MKSSAGRKRRLDIAVNWFLLQRKERWNTLRPTRWYVNFKISASSPALVVGPESQAFIFLRRHGGRAHLSLADAYPGPPQSRPERQCSTVVTPSGRELFPSNPLIAGFYYWVYPKPDLLTLRTAFLLLPIEPDKSDV